MAPPDSFRILLDESVDAPTLYETYHGVFISIQVSRRSMLMTKCNLTNLLGRTLIADPRPKRPKN